MNQYLQIFDQLSVRDRSERRIELVKQFAWAVPNSEAIDYLVSLSPIIEIGAGTGYWAHLVREAGGIVRAFDEQPYQNGYCDCQWTDVTVGDCTTVAPIFRPHLILVLATIRKYGLRVPDELLWRQSCLYWGC